MGKIVSLALFAILIMSCGKNQSEVANVQDELSTIEHLMGIKGENSETTISRLRAIKANLLNSNLGVLVIPDSALDNGSFSALIVPRRYNGYSKMRALIRVHGKIISPEYNETLGIFKLELEKLPKGKNNYEGMIIDDVYKDTVYIASTFPIK